MWHFKDLVRILGVSAHKDWLNQVWIVFYVLFGCCSREYYI